MRAIGSVALGWALHDLWEPATVGVHGLALSVNVRLAIGCAQDLILLRKAMPTHTITHS